MIEIIRRKEYEDLSIHVPDEKWAQIQQAELVPNQGSDAARLKFETLMQRNEKANEPFYFTNEEMFFSWKNGFSQIM